MKDPHVPWPLPASLGVATGIGLASVGPQLWLLVLLGLLGLFISRQPQFRFTLLVVALSLTLGAVRWLQWEARPDPAARLAGLPLSEYSGFSDGRVLQLEGPERISLWLSPQGSVPVGQVTVLGTVAAAAGKRNPGGFDFAAHLAARGIHAQLSVRELLRLQPRMPLRERLRAGLRRGLSEPQAALVEALTLGERGELGELRELFSRSGLAHLMALSGLHLGVLTAAASRLLRRFGWWHRPLLLLLIAAFLATVGVSASLLRAALMAVAWILTDLAGTGRPDSWTRLGLAAFITLLYRPVWLFDLSFQLSYLCLVGILGLAVPLFERLRNSQLLPAFRYLAAATLTSAAAQLPALSLTASVFGTVPLLAVAVNLIAIPVASLLVPLGLLAALAGTVVPQLAWLPNLLNGPLAQLLIRVAEAGAALPSVPWGEIGVSGHWYWACFSAALLLVVNGRLRPLNAAAVTAAALLAGSSTPSGQPAAELIALDVGQGDAFVLRFTDGPVILIDAGGNAWSDFDPGERIVVPALRALGVSALDLVIATHADADHIGGLPAVLAALPVQLLAVGVNAAAERPLFRELLAAATAHGVPVLQLTAGELLHLGAVTLQVLNPGPVPSGDANEDSVAVNVLLHGRPVAVLPGEVSAATEALLAFAPAPVLTVPHHGSRFSSSERLLRAVGGHTAVVSVGPNNYGHPHETVLARLDAHGYRLLSTLESGAVRVELRP